MVKKITTKNYNNDEFEQAIERAVTNALLKHGVIKEASKVDEPGQEEFINTAEAASFISVSLSTLYKMVRLDKLPYHKKGEGNSKVLFKRTELDAWMRSEKK